MSQREVKYIQETKKYNIIYADPPWRYDQKNLSGAAEKHYETLDINDICSLNIEELADNIMLAKEAVTDRSQTSDFRKIEFYQKQVAVGYLFKRIMNSADALVQPGCFRQLLRRNCKILQRQIGRRVDAGGDPALYRGPQQCLQRYRRGPWYDIHRLWRPDVPCHSHAKQRGRYRPDSDPAGGKGRNALPGCDRLKTVRLSPEPTEGICGWMKLR